LQEASVSPSAALKPASPASASFSLLLELLVELLDSFEDVLPPSFVDEAASFVSVASGPASAEGCDELLEHCTENNPATKATGARLMSKVRFMTKTSGRDTVA
jgi:hypothetical protein